MTTIAFLDPRGTATEVFAAAKRRGYSAVCLVTDRGLLTRDVELGSVDILDISSWDAESDWQGAFDVILKKHVVSGVYFNTDAAVIPGNAFRDRLGFAHTSRNNLERCLDKKLLRDFMRTTGLSQLNNIGGAEFSSLKEWPFAGPGFFKPAHGCASAYVSRVNDLLELQNAVSKFLDGNPTDPVWVEKYLSSSGKRYHVEEEVCGELLSVEAFSQNGQFSPLGLLSRILYSKDSTVEMGSVFPYHHPRSTAIVDYVRKVHEALGFVDGPTHTEVIISDSGRIELIDFNPRIVGADVLWSINYALDIELENYLLDWALGKRFEVSLDVNSYSCLQYILPPCELVFESLSMPTSPDVVYKRVFMEPGQEVKSIDQQLDYLGCYLTTGTSFEAAKDRSFEHRSAVLVNGRWNGSY